MGTYTYLENGFLDDPDYRSSTEKLVAIHLMNQMDPAGVAGWTISSAVARTAVSEKTIRKAILDLQDRRKLILSEDKRWVWLKSGIWYRLNKGRYSRPQMRGTVDKLHYWGARGVFERVGLDLFREELGRPPGGSREDSGNATGNFPLRVAQLYAVKYAVNIPLSSVPYYTLLLEEIDKRFNGESNVENLSTPAKRTFIKLSLSRYATQLDSQDVDWIQALFEDYSSDRILPVITWICTQERDLQQPGEPLEDFIRRLIERRRNCE